jgi:hypothetical protein
VHFILFIALFNRLKKAVNVWAITFPFFYFANSVLFASNRDSFSLSFVLFLFLSFFAAWFGSRTFFYAGFIMHEARFTMFSTNIAPASQLPPPPWRSLKLRLNFSVH